MKIKYFEDTDTALFEFSDREVAETREILENIYVDLDGHGDLVAMTIEHAREKGQPPRSDLPANGIRKRLSTQPTCA